MRCGSWCRRRRFRRCTGYGGAPGYGRSGRRRSSRGDRRGRLNGGFRHDRHARRSTWRGRDNAAYAGNTARADVGVLHHVAVNTQKKLAYGVHVLLRAHDLKLIERIAHLVSGVHDGICRLRFLLCRHAWVVDGSLGVVVPLPHILIERFHVSFIADAHAGGINSAGDCAERKGGQSGFPDGVPVRRIILVRHGLG